MIVAIIGPASCLANAVIDTIQRFMRDGVGETLLATSDDASELGRHLVSASRAHILFHCPEPSQELVQVFKRADIPVLIVIDDLFAHLAYLVDAVGTPWHGSYRDYMRLMCIFQPIIDDPYFGLLRRADVNDSLVGWLVRVFPTVSPVETVSEFVRVHFSLGVGEKGTTEEPIKIRSPEEFREALPSGAREEIEKALADYLPTLDRHRIEKITWRRQLFSTQDLPFGVDDIRIDTTGKARHLIFGPYFHIPVGSWRAIMRFALENALSGCDLVFDVYDIGRNEILFEGEVRTSQKMGAYACEFEFTVADATSPMEVRVFMKSGSIEGYFVFGDVDLIRLDKPLPLQQ